MSADGHMMPLLTDLHDAASVEATEYAIQDAWLADLEERVTLARRTSRVRAAPVRVPDAGVAARPVGTGLRLGGRTVNWRPLSLLSGQAAREMAAIARKPAEVSDAR